MNYFYARVSTARQNADRQLDAAKRAGFPKTRTFVDYESGKDFNRTNWTLLQTRLTAGDALFVKSIDRLGRNYKEILRVWQELTKDRGIDVVVLDMPLLDTRREKGLLGTFIADLVLQVLSFVAENERANIKERQKEGIAAALARGVKFGRPRRKLPPNFDDAVREWQAGRMSQTAAAKTCRLSLSTFRSACKRREEAQPPPTNVRQPQKSIDKRRGPIKNPSLSPLAQERVAMLLAEFGLGVFTTSEANGILGFKTLWETVKFLESVSNRGELKKLASAFDLQGYVIGSKAQNSYSFDQTKTLDDVLELLDPIPPENRSLEIQLFGQERERYEQIRAAVQNRQSRQ